MKITTIIDKNHEEEIIIYLHEKNALSEEIEKLILNSNTELIGYQGKKAVRLAPQDICCFFVQDNKVYAMTEKETYLIKQRLYVLEDYLGESFVKINQSCLANIKKIQKFDASLAGALTVTFQNGYRDYVSRRQIKNVKERFGI